MQRSIMTFIFPKTCSPECKKILAALFYGLMSFFITVVNKTVLTSYKFPSFIMLGIGQMTTTVVVLYAARQLNILSFPALENGTLAKVFPLPLLYAANMFTGLGGTQQISLPMLTALRRFSILMTMILEYFILRQIASCTIQMSVFAMVFGAVIAASNDLSFNVSGYSLLLFNDLFTALNSVVMKKKLDAKELGKWGLLFYNSLFMLPIACALAFITGDIEKAVAYDGWRDIAFLIQFSLSCLMGFLLQYSTVLCTQLNSALTTTVIGCLKNIAVTYLGMFIGGDYIFNLANFVGLNISIVGSLVYTWVTFRVKEETLPVYASLPTTEK
ncbi:UDP-sugar transporter UST74c-like isoform X1 [Artemia franciscana]|uniref:UDP-sugar transporter UST74c-like isoform X1 n=2 Tax=Artemia franciscana TaxID=6661 RepID=UPI0032DB479B